MADSTTSISERTITGQQQQQQQQQQQHENKKQRVASGSEDEKNGSSRNNNEENHDEKRPPSSSSLSSEEEEEEDESLRFQKRWLHQGDFSDMLHLLRHGRNAREGGTKKKTKIATYQWSRHDIASGVPPKHDIFSGVVCDILFVRGIPLMDNPHENFTDHQIISRTMPSGGTISFSEKVESGVTFVEGLLKRVDQPSVLHRGDRDRWQALMQMNDLGIRECHPEFPEDIVELGLPFSIYKYHGQPNHNYLEDPPEVLIYVLTNTTALEWTPTEASHPIGADGRAYTRFIQDQMQQQNEDYLYGWNADHSWLCLYKGLPAAVASHVHSFLRPGLPEPTWSRQRGDLVVIFDWFEWRLGRSTSWQTQYTVRPRDESVRDKLLAAAITDSPQSDSESPVAAAAYTSRHVNDLDDADFSPASDDTEELIHAGSGS